MPLVRASSSRATANLQLRALLAVVRAARTVQQRRVAGPRRSWDTMHGHAHPGPCQPAPGDHARGAPARSCARAPGSARAPPLPSAPRRLAPSPCAAAPWQTADAHGLFCSPAARALMALRRCAGASHSRPTTEPVINPPSHELLGLRGSTLRSGHAGPQWSPPQHRGSLRHACDSMFHPAVRVAERSATRGGARGADGPSRACARAPQPRQPRPCMCMLCAKHAHAHARTRPCGRQ